MPDVSHTTDTLLFTFSMGTRSVTTDQSNRERNVGQQLRGGVAPAERDFSERQ